MDTLIYFVKTGLFYSLLFGFYYLFFRNNTNFQINRAYLILIIPLSFLLPVLNTTVQVAQEYQVVLPTIEISAIATPTVNFNWENLIVYCYIVISSILLLVLLKNLHQTITTIRSIKKGSNKEIQPFSFFAFIHVPHTIEEKDRNAIMFHEKVHSEQWHSVDIIIYEISKIILWWNPLLWMGLNTVKGNHEFIADKLASVKADKYSSVLVAQLLGVNCSTLANNFKSNHLLKKRIMMMKTKTTNKLSLVKYVLIIPIIAIALVATAQEKVNPPPIPPKAPSPADKIQFEKDYLQFELDQTKMESDLVKIEQNKANIENERVKIESDLVKIKSDLAKIDLDKVKIELEKTKHILNANHKIDVKPEFKGGQAALIKYIGSHVKYPEAAKENNIEGKVYIAFLVDVKGNIKNPEVVRSAHKLLDIEAMRVIKSMPKWNPGKKDGKNVAAKVTLPIAFKNK